MRIGQGFDVHAFANDRPLILGGIHVPHTQGLAGHSDADVLIHAICDALLGAAGLGDIGTHFPDTDAQYKNQDSCVFLTQIMQLLREHQLSLGNLDATIVAQAPKMAPFIAAMRDKLAQVMQVDATSINIKATTTEKLGFTGRGEGIAAQAVVLLHNNVGA